MEASPAKLVVVCRTMPPLVVGSSVLMHNLFRDYRGKLEAIAGWEYVAKVDPAFTPPCKTHYLRFRPAILQRVMDHFKGLCYFFVRWFVYFKLRRLKPTAVLAACTPDGLFFTASFLACRSLHIPFWGHMHDLWQENTREGSFERSLATKWEPTIFREADKLFCMTENQVEHYAAKYDRAYEIIPHCVPADAEMPEEINVTTKTSDQTMLILYTGNISRYMNLDALREFAECIDLLPANYRAKLLTSFNAEQCRKQGIYHERIEHGWVGVAESRKLIREADILFLPLSFKNCAKDEVRTVFATKTLDYLTSGVPILVYSPPESYHSRCAKQGGWGCVVEEEDPTALARKIQELATNPILRKAVVAGAMQEARRRSARRWAEYLEQETARAASRGRQPPRVS